MRKVKLVASYAFSIAESQTLAYEYGEGLVGQVAKEAQPINIDNVPDDYIKIFSGLGSATPKNLLVAPLKGDEEEAYGVIEIASFTPFSKQDEELVERVFQMTHDKLNKGLDISNLDEAATDTEKEMD